MIKYLFLLLTVIINSVSAQIQILNGGFEDWEAIKNFEEPIGWYTNNDTSKIGIVKDTISIEGNYSIKFIPAISGPFACSSIAGKTIIFKEPLPASKSLVFYVKSIPFNPNQDTGVYIIVFGKLFHGDKVISSYDWSSFAPIEEFTRIEIPFPGENIDKLSMLIYGGASSTNSDVCGGKSYTWIDGMSIEAETAVEPSQAEQKVFIYPNPSSGSIYIECPEGNIKGYELYSLLGEFIDKGAIENGQFKIEQKGIYVLKLFEATDSRNVFYKKVVVQ